MNTNANDNNKRSIHPVERQKEATIKTIVCALTSMYDSNKRNKLGIGYKNSVSRYNSLVLSKSYILGIECATREYITGQGGVMEITYPKHRIVRTTFYKDRMIQTSFILNYFYPKVLSKITENSHACIKGRGVDSARNRLKDILKDAPSDYYCLKMDITNYFGSIHHKELINEMMLYIKDEWCLWYYINVIKANNGEIGIGLGSEIHQLSAIMFLNNLDKIITEYKNSYIRYQDDFIFIGSKEECLSIKSFVEVYLDKKKLKISNKKTFIQKVTLPIKFLGFSFLKHSTGKITMKRLKNKVNDEKRRLRKMKRNNVPIEKVKQHYNSVRAMMRHGNRSGVYKLDRFVKELWSDIK